LGELASKPQNYGHHIINEFFKDSGEQVRKQSAFYLEVPFPKISLIARSRDHHRRPSVGLGVGQPGEPVHAPGAGDGEEHRRVAGEVPVGGGGVPRRLLVVEGEESDAKRHRARAQGGDGDADYPEHVPHAGRGERARGEGVAVDLGF